MGAQRAAADPARYRKPAYARSNTEVLSEAPMSRRARRGASAIEFALTMPAFVLLLALFTD